MLISTKDDYLAIGLRDEGGLHGLALILNIKEKQLVETGFYMGNQLHGYCL